jgi:anti-anti-sigma regulatory factor
LGTRELILGPTYISDDHQVGISVERGVTVARLGTGFESLYESDLVHLKSVRELADTAAPPIILIDLSDTKYFGSAFIGFAIDIANRLKERGEGRLGICGLASFARMDFEKTKADTLLELFDDLDTAVSELASTAE